MFAPRVCRRSATAAPMPRAAPVISTLARDPSLRGLTKALSLALVGVQMRMVTLDDLARPKLEMVRSQCHALEMALEEVAVIVG